MQEELLPGEPQSRSERTPVLHTRFPPLRQWSYPPVKLGSLVAAPVWGSHRAVQLPCLPFIRRGPGARWGSRDGRTDEQGFSSHSVCIKPFERVRWTREYRYYSIVLSRYPVDLVSDVCCMPMSMSPCVHVSMCLCIRLLADHIWLVSGARFSTLYPPCARAGSSRSVWNQTLSPCTLSTVGLARVFHP